MAVASRFLTRDAGAHHGTGRAGGSNPARSPWRAKGASGEVATRRWALVWLLATAVVLLATLWPPSAFQAHAHWERVTWMPLADPASKPWELLANILLFVPFGYAGARLLGSDRRAAVIVSVLGGALSVAVEGAQVFAHGHYPSATDVVMNLTGAVAGGVLARRSARRPD